MLEKRMIIVGRRSWLSPAQERAVVRKFKAWAKDLDRKPTLSEALDYFMVESPKRCLWPEFAEILRVRGMV
jgi:hypothetical protein